MNARKANQVYESQHHSLHFSLHNPRATAAPIVCTPLHGVKRILVLLPHRIKVLQSQNRWPDESKKKGKKKERTRPSENTPQKQQGYIVLRHK